MAEVPKLPSGLYMIKSHIESDRYAGRDPVEDGNNDMKKVVIHSYDSATGDMPQKIRWHAEALVNGRYILRVIRNPTTTVDNLVFALLTGEERRNEWVITLHPQHGPNAYTIMRWDESDQGKGWISEEPGAQIPCKFLKVGTSYQLYYPPNQLWSFMDA